MNPVPDELITATAKYLGVDDLPITQQHELIASFGEVALKAATLSVAGKLTPDKRDEFAKLAEAGDAAALKTFFDREVPGHERLAKAAVDEEVKKFKAFQTADAGAGSKP